MLPKKYRATRRDVLNALDKGKNRHGRFFRLVTKENAKGPLFSFTISKKYAKRAIDRNRVRRNGYRVISPLISSYNLKKTHIFIATKDIMVATRPELEVDIMALLL